MEDHRWQLPTRSHWNEVRARNQEDDRMDRRPEAVFHVGALPISIEIKRARRDSSTDNVVMLVTTAPPKRSPKATGGKSRRSTEREP